MNWRQHLIANRRKTYIIMASFIALYAMLGAVSVLFFTPHYGMDAWLPILARSDSQQIIATFMAISCVIIFIAMLFGGKLTLSGTDAIQVTRDATQPQHQQLYNVVEELKIASSMDFMPKVYVMRVGYMNAFASGWHEKNAVVAITEPLLNILTREELQGVMAHELSHIRHQDTRVMTLVGVASSLLVWLIDILFRQLLYSNHRRNRRRNDASGIMIIVVMALRFILPILTAFMVMYVSRKREFLADAGCVEITRNTKGLASALRKIHQGHEQHKEKMKEAYQSTPNEQMRSQSYIYSPLKGGVKNWMNINDWFATHPSLKERLEMLGEVSSND